MEWLNGKSLMHTDLLSIGYPSKAGPRALLTQLNLRLREGDFIALAGPNGSGKSTLIRTLAGLQKPLQGTVYLLGEPVSSLSAARLSRQIAFVGTDWIQVNNLKVVDLVSLGRFPYTGFLGKLSADDYRICEEAIRITGLEALSHRHFDELSDGEKQRAMIARALAQQTPIIFLDEPIAFLDISHKFEIIRILADLSRNHGKCILFSIHDIHIAMREAGFLWLIQNDTILTGTPEDCMLNGSLKEVVGGDLLEINPFSGEFYLPAKTRVFVSLDGKGYRTDWTIRALERNEIGINRENEKAEIRVQVNELDWEVYQQQERIFQGSSIAELTSFLKSNFNL